MDEEVKAAVAWWCDRLREPAGIQDAGTRTVAEMELSVQITLDRSREPVEEERITIFSLALDRLMREKYQKVGWYPWDPGQGGYKRAISTDYEATGVLAEALTIAGISHRALPIKTVMWVNPGEVLVRQGYGAPVEILYGDE